MAFINKLFKRFIYVKSEFYVLNNVLPKLLRPINVFAYNSRFIATLFTDKLITFAFFFFLFFIILVNRERNKILVMRISLRVVKKKITIIWVMLFVVTIIKSNVKIFERIK